ncbi:MAG: hypothetical protein HYW62_00610 [Candidatus Levybacteria bacterium]|nr:hypothetical protein [Candidatus Levybacteria bacterium]
MTKKSLVVISILSIVATYGFAIIDALANPSANQSGLPFKFGSYALFGTASTNYSVLVLDIAFWFVVIWGIWKIFLNKSKSKK